MSNRSAMTGTDALAVLRLVGECEELWADPQAWQKHLLDGAVGLVGGKTGLWFEADPHPDEVYDLMDSGWSVSERRHFQAAWAARTMDFHPAAKAMVRSFRGRHAVTRERREHVACRDWYRHPAFEKFIRPADNDDYLTSTARRRDRRESVMLVVNRRPDDRRFTRRDHRVLHLLGTAVAERVGVRLATRRHRCLEGLSVRRRTVLARLLAGDAEKQAAAALGIGQSTVHDHVKALHRHFGVQSRAELLAYFIARRPEPRAQPRTRARGGRRDPSPGSPPEASDRRAGSSQAVPAAPPP